MKLTMALFHWILYPTLLDYVYRPPNCKTLPGDPDYPDETDLKNFNQSIDGRLLKIVPSAQFCKNLPGGGCSDAEWFNGNFRKTIPGAMLQVNWEQDYTADPPSLCFRNSTTCSQGNVPVLGVNATTHEHIQAGVLFAKRHSLKVAIKASGHDYLGRSTSRDSFLLWTRYLQNVTFHDNFQVNGEDLGSAVTVGSGVDLHTLYRLTKERGKIFVGGTAAGVVASGGYVQGGGHSALSPLFGLAADNALQFDIVVADGSFLTVNSISHPDLFWALRGGGAGSWGVLISTTFRVYPTFDGVHHSIHVILNSSEQVGLLAQLHARYISSWDVFKAGQYFYTTGTPQYAWHIDTFFPQISIENATKAMQPFVDEIHSLGFTSTTSAELRNVNELLGSLETDLGGSQVILGSRLIPTTTYEYYPALIGHTYTKLYDSGVYSILGHLVAGGQVHKNRNIDSAVNPSWRYAKTHIVVVRAWNETTSLKEVERIQKDMTENQVPMLKHLAGGLDGAYSNEADVREPNFQKTFFGPNYKKLLSVKRNYDPDGLFIVPAGVGSDYFDSRGVCKL